MADWTPAILLLGLAAAVLFHGRKQFQAGREALRLGIASLQWPKALGRITASEVQTVDHGGNVGHCLPVVSYTFAVESATYTGSAISFRNPESTKKSATAIVARYPVGSEVTVSYDPNYPAACVLEPGTEGVQLYFMWGRVSIFVGIAIAIVAIAVPILRKMYP